METMLKWKEKCHMQSKNELLKKIEDGNPKFSKGQKKLAELIQ